jgi:hypothetical protein
MSCERRMRYELQTFENASRAAAMVYSKAGVSEFACNVREKPWRLSVKRTGFCCGNWIRDLQEHKAGMSVFTMMFCEWRLY